METEREERQRAVEAERAEMETERWRRREMEVDERRPYEGRDGSERLT